MHPKERLLLMGIRGKPPIACSKCLCSGCCPGPIINDECKNKCPASCTQDLVITHTQKNLYRLSCSKAKRFKIIKISDDYPSAALKRRNLRLCKTKEQHCQ